MHSAKGSQERIRASPSETRAMAKPARIAHPRSRLARITSKPPCPLADGTSSRSRKPSTIEAEAAGAAGDSPARGSLRPLLKAGLSSRAPRSRSIQSGDSKPAPRHAAGTATSSGGGKSTRQVRSSTGRSSTPGLGSTRQTPIPGAASATLRTMACRRRRPTGRSIVTVSWSRRSLEASRTPSIRMPCSRLPAGSESVTEERP